jgi:hypothetical protein
MKQIVLNENNKPELLLDLQLGDDSIDLHNDFDCLKIEVDNDTLIIQLAKSHSDKSCIPKTRFSFGRIEFHGFEVDNLSDILLQKFPLTIDNFSIGSTLDDRKCLFVLGFVGTDEYEIMATEVNAKFW